MFKFPHVFEVFVIPQSSKNISFALVLTLFNVLSERTKIFSVLVRIY